MTIEELKAAIKRIEQAKHEAWELFITASSSADEEAALLRFYAAISLEQEYLAAQAAQEVQQ